jgi:hypothetical protein
MFISQRIVNILTLTRSSIVYENHIRMNFGGLITVPKLLLNGLRIHTPLRNAAMDNRLSSRSWWLIRCVPNKKKEKERKVHSSNALSSWNRWFIWGTWFYCFTVLIFVPTLCYFLHVLKSFKTKVHSFFFYQCNNHNREEKLENTVIRIKYT